MNTQTNPTHEEIETLAYRFWEERGRPSGSAEEDWFRAEREMYAGSTGRHHLDASITLPSSSLAMGPIGR